MEPTPLAIMAEHLPQLEGANRRLAQWYLDTLGSGAPLPLNHDCNDVASAVGVSRATVIRFARILGYNGFTAFRNALFQFAGQAGNTIDNTKLMGKPQSLTETTLRQVEALHTSLQLVNTPAFVQAAEWVAHASSILWIGWGDSYFTAASGEHKCRLGGFMARSANDVADLGLHVASLMENALIVVVTQSGRWQAIVSAVRSAQKRGIHVVCLAGNASSALAKAANITFVTANPTYRVAGHPFTLRAAQGTLIDALVLEAVRIAGKHAVEPPQAI